MPSAELLDSSAICGLASPIRVSSPQDYNRGGNAANGHHDLFGASTRRSILSWTAFIRTSTGTDTRRRPSRSGRCSPGPSSRLWSRSSRSVAAASPARNPPDVRVGNGCWSRNWRSSRSTRAADRGDTGEDTAVSSPVRQCVQPSLRFRAR